MLSIGHRKVPLPLPHSYSTLVHFAGNLLILNVTHAYVKSLEKASVTLKEKIEISHNPLHPKIHETVTFCCVSLISCTYMSLLI